MTAPPSLPSPTATTVPSLRAVAAMTSAPVELVIRLQLVPSQCSKWLPPKAQMLLAETAAITPNELVPLGLGFGLATKLQLVPSQCAIAASVSFGPGSG